MLKIAPPALAMLYVIAASPAMAEMTHHYSGRFGVSYTSGQNGTNGTTQPMYEGTYTVRFTHQTDMGVRFRFDLGITASNFEPRRPNPWLDDTGRR